MVRRETKITTSACFRRCCEAMVHTPKECRRKWHMKSEKCIFLGYLEDGNGYRLYNKSFQKIVKARDVVFIENVQRKEGVSSKQTATKGVMTMCEETLDHDSNESAEVRNDDLSCWISGTLRTKRKNPYLLAMKVLQPKNKSKQLNPKRLHCEDPENLLEENLRTT